MTTKERDTRLTPRQVQIVELIADGYTDREVARELGTQPSTVKALVGDALRRTHSVNRTQLVVKWIRGEVT